MEENISLKVFLSAIFTNSRYFTALATLCLLVVPMFLMSQVSSSLKTVQSETRATSTRIAVRSNINNLMLDERTSPNQRNLALSPTNTSNTFDQNVLGITSIPQLKIIENEDNLLFFSYSRSQLQKNSYSLNLKASRNFGKINLFDVPRSQNREEYLITLQNNNQSQPLEFFINSSKYFVNSNKKFKVKTNSSLKFAVSNNESPSSDFEIQIVRS